VWDDHDYGINNGNSDFHNKHEMREHFLEFIGEPPDSVRSLEKDTPIHADYIINKSISLL